MTRYGQLGWRIAALAAFVGTAALAVILSRAPVRSAANLSSDVTGRLCLSSGLEAWLGLGAAGATSTARTGGPGTHTYLTLEFTNVSDRACSLYGYPEVSAFTDSRVTGGQATRGQIGSAAIRDTSVRPQPVTLAPGATAHSILRVIVTGGIQPVGCAQVTAEALRVTLPRQARSAFVPVHIPVCSKQGHSSLSVQAIQARPGVPGHTMVP
jgi:hypothetical protein